MTRFGEVLRNAREREKLSQGAFARRVRERGHHRFQQSLVSKYELGKVEAPAGSLLVAMAESLGLTPAALLGQEEAASPSPAHKVEGLKSDVTETAPTATGHERDILVVRMLASITEQNGRLVTLTEKLDARLSRIEDQLEQLGAPVANPLRLGRSTPPAEARTAEALIETLARMTHRFDQVETKIDAIAAKAG